MGDVSTVGLDLPKSIFHVHGADAAGAVVIRKRLRPWRNTFGCLAAAVILPVFIVFKILIMPFERPIVRSAEEVAGYLRGYRDGTGGDWDFDDFECIPIADPRLDDIRERASRIPLPITGEGLAALDGLLAEAEALAEEEGRQG